MRKSVLSLLILIILLGSCIDTIDLELPENKVGRIVVAGSVVRSPDDYVFRAAVRRTVQVVDEFVFELDEANISILFNGNEVLSLSNNDPLQMGVEQFHSDFGGTPENAVFRLRAEVSDGRILESADQKILNPPTETSLEVGLDTRLFTNESDNIVERTFVELFINSPLENEQGERLSFLWEVSGVYSFPEITWTDNPFWFGSLCYIPAPPLLNEVNVVSSSDINTSELVRFKINEKQADFKYYNGYYYTVVLKAIDDSAAEYWKEVASSIKRDGTLFDTPPGKVRTNLQNVNDALDNQVLGYFYAAGIDTVRHLATPSETGFQRHLCNPLDTIPVPCCDCINGFRNSTLNKPSYWK